MRQRCSLCRLCTPARSTQGRSTYQARPCGYAAGFGRAEALFNLGLSQVVCRGQLLPCNHLHHGRLWLQDLCQPGQRICKSLSLDVAALGCAAQVVCHAGRCCDSRYDCHHPPGVPLEPASSNLLNTAEPACGQSACSYVSGLVCQPAHEARCAWPNSTTLCSLDQLQLSQHEAQLAEANLWHR